MAIDRAAWRAEKLTERVTKALRDEPERYPFMEQDALNAALKGNFAPLSPRFNFMGDFFLLDLERRLEPIVLHFVNAPKPWELGSWRGEARFAENYRAWFAASPWPDLAKAPATPRWRRTRPPLTPLRRDFAKRLSAFLAETRFIDGTLTVQARALKSGSGILKATFWFVAMACGCFQVVQAMSNGSAVRSGIGPIWVGAMSATISTLTLILVAVVIYRLPLPDKSLVMAQGMKVVAGGMMGAFIVAGLAFVAPRLGPTQTFMLYFFVIAVTSALIDGFGLMGTEARPLEARQLVGVLLAGVGLVLARS